VTEVKEFILLVFNRLVKRLILAAIALYRMGVSPFTQPRCRFLPTCSSYAQEAIEVHGVIKGGILALKRLIRCHPWGQSGFDPVPT